MNSDKKLIDTYVEIMEEVHQVCKLKHDDSLPVVDQAIEKACLEHVNKKLLTSLEAEKLGFYLRRDLHDMAQFLEEDENALPDNWLSFDLRLAENRTWEMFLSIADKTRVELSTFSHRLKNPGDYMAGEITGLGTLECMACGNLLHFYKADLIPACSECGSTGYMRIKD